MINSDRPAERNITYDELVAGYYEQAQALLDGGVDLLLCETTFDTLNLKAALFAIQKLFDEGARRVPLMASLTITDLAGGNLSGQNLEAMWNSIAHAPLLSVGLNCALWAGRDAPLHGRIVAYRARVCQRLSERRDCRTPCAIPALN